MDTDMAEESVGGRVLWGVGSPRTMRAHWALHELLLPYEIEAIESRSGETQTAQFSALNPRQKIPVLQDGDFTIAESPAIVAYLAEVYGSGKVRLLPARQRERAQCYEWNFFLAMELDATALYVIRRHTGLAHIHGEATMAVESAKSYFFKQLGCVDQTLRAGGPFLMGDGFTTADILLTTCLTWALMRQVPIYDSCRGYLDRVMKREGYAKGAAANASRPLQSSSAARESRSTSA